MKVARGLFRFFDQDRLSIIDMAAVALLFQWIAGGGWQEFWFLLGFLVIMGLLKASVTLGEETAHLNFVAEEIKKYTKPKEDYPVDEWDEKPIE